MKIEIVQVKANGIHVTTFKGKIRIELDVNLWEIDHRDMPTMIHIYKKRLELK